MFPFDGKNNYRTEKINYRMKMGNLGKMGENRIIEQQRSYRNYRTTKKVRSKFRYVFLNTFRGKQNYRTGPNPRGMGIRRSTKVRYFPNPRGIGIRRSTKVRYFTVLLYSWLRSIILALTVHLHLHHHHQYHHHHHHHHHHLHLSHLHYLHHLHIFHQPHLYDMLYLQYIHYLHHHLHHYILYITTHITYIFCTIFPTSS